MTRVITAAARSSLRLASIQNAVEGKTLIVGDPAYILKCLVHLQLFDEESRSNGETICLIAETFGPADELAIKVVFLSFPYRWMLGIHVNILPE